MEKTEPRCQGRKVGMRPAGESRLWCFVGIGARGAGEGRAVGDSARVGRDGNERIAAGVPATIRSLPQRARVYMGATAEKGTRLMYPNRCSGYRKYGPLADARG